MTTLRIAAFACAGLMTLASTGADQVTIPLNNGNSSDNFLYNNGPTDNFANNQLYYYDERGSQLDKGRPLIKFNLAALPPCATITNVQLQLWVEQYTFIDSNNNNATVPWNFSLNQMLVDWDEATSNWNSRSTGMPWNAPGMGAGTDYSATPAATTLITGASAVSGQYKSWDITALYQSSAHGESPNYGVYLHGPVGNPTGTTFTGDTTDGVFYCLASEYDNDTRRPHLVIEYTLAAGECNACCFADGSCQAKIGSDCTAAQGTPQPSGSVCSPNTCPAPAACCAASGTCSFVAPANCTGTPQGPGSTCTPPPCAPPAGACCCGAACTITAPSGCVGTNKVFVGSGSACVPFSLSVPCCRGNYNKSAATPHISVQDIFDFLAGYFSNDPCANTNDRALPVNTNGVSVQDIFDFLAAYFAGGC